MTDTQTPKPIPFRMGELLTAWQEDAAAAHEAFTSGTPRGPVTGLSELDRELSGYLAPGLHIVHGAPGAGKTAFALQVAGTCGCPAVYMTCEMSPLELLRRLTARVTKTYLGKLKTGELSPQESMALARRAVATVPDLWLMDATACYPYRSDLEAVARTARGDGRHVLVVVDSVHAWAAGAPGDLPEYEALNSHLQTLNGMALALDCPVLAVAERNRMSMGKGGMSAGAGTRKLEYGAWTVMDLDRDENAREDPLTKEVPITLKLPKNRSNRPHGKVPLLFHGALQTFRVDG